MLCLQFTSSTHPCSTAASPAPPKNTLLILLLVLLLCPLHDLLLLLLSKHHLHLQLILLLQLPPAPPAPPAVPCTSSSCSCWICRPISASRTNGKKCGQFKRAAARRIYHENPIKSGQRSVWDGGRRRWHHREEATN